MSVQRHQRRGSVTLDASGAGEVSLGDVPTHSFARVQSVHVRRSSTSEPYNPARAEVYVGDEPSPVDGTYSGDLDTTTSVGVLLGGEKVRVAFTNGDTGDVYEATVSYTLHPA